MPSEKSRIENRLLEIYEFLNSDRFPYLFVVLCSAVILSFFSAHIFINHGFHIAHFDAKGHLLVSRRLFDNLNPGFKQIGAFWLPLPHLIYLPFVWNDDLYFSGLAATPVSMLCFVTTVWLFFRLVETVFDRFAAFCTSVLYLTNPNLLYLQTTALTENLSLLFMIDAVYSFILFSKDKKRKLLVACSILLALGILTRYENWVLFASVGLMLIVISIKERKGMKDFILDSLLLGIPNLIAIAFALWINWYTTGNIFLDISYKRIDFQPAQGSFFIAFFVILYTLGNLISFDWTIFAIIGACFAAKKRFHSSQFLASLTLLSPFLLYIYEYQNNHPTRIRYGLPFIPAGIFFLAYWPGRSRLMTFLFLIWTGHILLTSPFSRSGSSELLLESMRDSDNLSIQEGLLDYVREHDDRTLILASMSDNAPILYDLKLPVKRYVHEGAKPYWNDAVTDAHPEKVVGWVLMSKEDRVWIKLHDDPEFRKNFVLIGRNGLLELYHLKK